MSEYKALAGRIEAMARSYEDRSRLARTTQEDGTSERHSECAADLRTVVSLLEGMAEEKPAAWMALAYGLPSQATTDEPTAIRWRKAGGDVVPLYTHPAPQPQAEPKHGINWQPIQTAPRDNKRPLLLASFDDRGVLSNVDFNGSWECESESWEMPQEYYFWDSANGMADEPTHWAYQPEGFAQLTKETAVPQAEPKREALSDDEILDILDIATAADLRFSMYSDDVETRAAIKRLARAVERAAYERAARVCCSPYSDEADDPYEQGFNRAAEVIADAIRALGRQHD